MVFSFTGKPKYFICNTSDMHTKVKKHAAANGKKLLDISIFKILQDWRALDAALKKYTTTSTPFSEMQVYPIISWFQQCVAARLSLTKQMHLLPLPPVCGACWLSFLPPTPSQQLLWLA